MKFRLVPEQLCAEIAQYIQNIPSGNMPVSVPVRLLSVLQQTEIIDRAPAAHVVKEVKDEMAKTEKALEDEAMPTTTEPEVLEPEVLAS